MMNGMNRKRPLRSHLTAQILKEREKTTSLKDLIILLKRYYSSSDVLLRSELFNLVLNAWQQEFTLTNEDFLQILLPFHLEEELHFWFLKNHPKDALRNISTLLDAYQSVKNGVVPDEASLSFLRYCLKTCDLFNPRNQKSEKLWISFLSIETDVRINSSTREGYALQNHCELMTSQQEHRLRGLLDETSSMSCNVTDECDGLRTKIDNLMERIVPSTAITDRKTLVIDKLSDFTFEEVVTTGVTDHLDAQPDDNPMESLPSCQSGLIQTLVELYKNDRIHDNDKMLASIHSVSRSLEGEKDLDALAFHINYLLTIQMKLFSESSKRRYTFMSKLGQAHPFSQELDKAIQKTFNTLTSSGETATGKDVLRIMRLLPWQPYSIMEQMIQNSIRSTESNATFLSVLHRCPSLVKFTCEGANNVLSIMVAKCFLEVESFISMELHRRNLLTFLKRLVELQVCSIDFLMTEVLMIPLDGGFKASKVLKFVCEFKKMFQDETFTLKHNLTSPKLMEYLVNGYSMLLDDHADVNDLAVILEDTLIFIQDIKTHFNSKEQMKLPVNMDAPLKVCLSPSMSLQEDHGFDMFLWMLILDINEQDQLVSRLQTMETEDLLYDLANVFLRCGPILFETLYQKILPHLNRLNCMYETLQWGDKEEIMLQHPADMLSLDQLEKITVIFHVAVRLNVSTRLRFSISLTRNLVFAVEKVLEESRTRALNEQLWVHLRCLQIICFILSTMDRYMKEVIKDSDCMRPMELVLSNVLYGLDRLRHEWITDDAAAVTAVTPHCISQVQHFIAYWISRIHESVQRQALQSIQAARSKSI